MVPHQRRKNKERECCLDTKETRPGPCREEGACACCCACCNFVSVNTTIAVGARLQCFIILSKPTTTHTGERRYRDYAGGRSLHLGPLHWGLLLEHLKIKRPRSILTSMATMARKGKWKRKVVLCRFSHGTYIIYLVIKSIDR